MPLPKFIRSLNLLALTALFIASCNSATPTESVFFPTYDPFLPMAGSPVEYPSTPDPNATRQPTPTRVPLTISPPASISADQSVSTPTPDTVHAMPALRREAEQYVVQPGDTLGLIAQNYGISVGTLMQANNITDANLLEVGMTLNVPAPNPADAGTAFKVVPDSELVYGPASIYFDINDFIQGQHGYLASYTQEVNGNVLTAEEIVYLVASNY